MFRARPMVLALSLAFVAPPLTAQLSAPAMGGTASSITIVSDRGEGPGEGLDNPIYQRGGFGAGSVNAATVNLWFRDATGTVGSACTGTMLNARQLLTAAHCVSRGGALTSASFTARFRVGAGTTAADWIEVSGTQYAVRDGYVGGAYDERDVAVLTLSDDAPNWAIGNGLSDSPALGEARIGGYGRAGVVDDLFLVQSNQLTDAAVLRTGYNMFETTCRTGGQCARADDPDVAGFGGILLADMDRSGRSANGALCALGFCTAGLDGLREVGVSFGDSGSAAFDVQGRILGVASFAVLFPGGTALAGFEFGYACVANVAGNEGCQSNHRWVQSQLVPEPSTYAMLATGLVGLLAVARRRRV